MPSRARTLALLAMTGFPSAAFSGGLSVSSPSTRVHVIELFTSEGCSSCPPAEKWLAALRSQPELGQRFIPLAFHVDYWDYLGWRDRFSSPAFTQRQEQYSREWPQRRVYTPGFVLNGKEWGDRRIPSASTERPGVLTLRSTESTLTLSFAPESLTTPANAWLATLHPPESSNVKAGENHGRKLEHDFAVKSLQRLPLKEAGGSFEAKFDLPNGARHGGWVAWVTTGDSLAPRQAVALWRP